MLLFTILIISSCKFEKKNNMDTYKKYVYIMCLEQYLFLNRTKMNSED
jgi:hypothetical protein